MRMSSRGEVEPFIAMDVMESARQLEAQGRSIIRMEVGQPATPAPEPARAAVAQALATQPLGYTPALGLPELRARLAQLYAERHGLEIDPARVVITSGSSAGFILAFTALFDAGARVAIADPSYPAYRNILKALDLRLVRMEATEVTRFQPTPQLVANAGRLGRLDGVLIASPGNPTGAMLSRDAMIDLVEECQRIGAALISDEIYHGVHYDAAPVSALEVTNDVYVVNSFSKYFSMTGWRVGWMVVPEADARRLERLSQNLFICPPHASQIAALAALDAAEALDANVAAYAANRALLLEGLPKAGFDRFAPPDGAFYLYLDVADRTRDSRDLARRLLEEAGVAVTPGLDFDPVRGMTTLRLSYAGATEEIAEGLRRLQAWAAENPPLKS